MLPNRGLSPLDARLAAHRNDRSDIGAAADLVVAQSDASLKIIGLESLVLATSLRHALAGTVGVDMQEHVEISARGSAIERYNPFQG